MLRFLESKGALRDFVWGFCGQLHDLSEECTVYRCTVLQICAFVLLRIAEIAALCGIVYLLAILPA